MTDRFTIKIGDLDPIQVISKNRRSAINKTLTDPDSIAVVQEWATSATLYRVHFGGEVERIGQIWRVQG